MFKLSWPLSISGTTGPLIIPRNIFPSTLINHWLNRKDMSRFHESHSLIFWIVRYLRCLMKHRSDSVTCVSSHYGISQRLNMIGNYVAYLSVHATRFTILNSFLEGIICSLNKISWTLTNFSDEIGFIHVCVISIFKDTYIKIDYVSIF